MGLKIVEDANDTLLNTNLMKYYDIFKYVVILQCFL